MIRNASGYRLGIYLESYSSENKKPVINIFDGSDTNPKVVLGKLDGTPKSIIFLYGVWIIFR